METLMVEKRKEALEQTKKSQEYLDILIESLKTLQKQVKRFFSYMVDLNTPPSPAGSQKTKYYYNSRMLDTVQNIA